MSGQAGIDSTLDLNGVGSVQSPGQVDSSYSNVGSNIDSTLDAQYQGSFADIGVTGAQVSSSYQSNVEQAASTTTTTATYESAFSVTASQGRGEVSTNVSAFIEPENAYILGIIADLGINDDMAEEMRLELIMNLLANNFAYEPDSAGEAWNTVNETLSTKSGDCEDLSNLAASLLLAAGFPAEDVNVYVDLQANGAQGHVVVGIMMNDQEVKLDIAQLITDKDGNYAQINESFYANNQLNRSSYDFSYSVNGVEKLNVNLSSNIVMEDINNADSFYTAAVPLPLPSFMSLNEQDGTYTINGTHGKDTFNFTKSGNGILLTYNNVNYYLTRDYGVAATAQMTVRGGGGGDILEKAAGIDVTDLLEAEIQPPSSLVVVAADGNSITITGGATADNIALTKDANGHNILTYKANGTTFIYDLTRLYHDKAINIDSGAGNDTITVNNVAINSITMGDGANNVTLDGSSTVNSITGGVGVDTITLKGQSKVTGEINAGDGNDIINLEGTASANLISGGAGVDTITLKGNSKVNAIDAGVGADVISLKESAISTSIVGGDGKDTITLTDSSRAGAISGGNGDDTITLSLSSMAHGISGGEGNDTILLKGTSQSNYIEGDAGNDTITLDGGKVNILNGGIGADTIKVQTTGHANSITDDIADHLSLTATNPTGGNATYGYFPTTGPTGAGGTGGTGSVGGTGAYTPVVIPPPTFSATTILNALASDIATGVAGGNQSAFNTSAHQTALDALIATCLASPTFMSDPQNMNNLMLQVMAANANAVGSSFYNPVTGRTTDPKFQNYLLDVNGTNIGSFFENKSDEQIVSYLQTQVLPNIQTALNTFNRSNKTEVDMFALQQQLTYWNGQYNTLSGLVNKPSSLNSLDTGVLDNINSQIANIANGILDRTSNISVNYTYQITGNKITYTEADASSVNATDVSNPSYMNTLVSDGNNFWSHTHSDPSLNGVTFGGIANIVNNTTGSNYYLNISVSTLPASSSTTYEGSQVWVVNQEQAASSGLAVGTVIVKFGGRTSSYEIIPPGKITINYTNNLNSATVQAQTTQNINTATGLYSSLLGTNGTTGATLNLTTATDAEIGTYISGTLVPAYTGLINNLTAAIAATPLNYSQVMGCLNQLDSYNINLNNAISHLDGELNYGLSTSLVAIKTNLSNIIKNLPKTMPSLQISASSNMTQMNEANALFTLNMKLYSIGKYLKDDFSEFDTAMKGTMTVPGVPTPGPTPITPPRPGVGEFFNQLNAAFLEGGAKALTQEAFSIAVDRIIAIAPPGSSKYEQMLYSMANTIEALFETLLLMSDFMANNETFAENPGDLYSLQQEIQQVKDTISTLTAVGSLSTDVLKTHMSQFISDLNK